MMTEEQFAKIHERLTNGEYPQPMVVLRDAQALADEVERLSALVNEAPRESPSALLSAVHTALGAKGQEATLDAVNRVVAEAREAQALTASRASLAEAYNEQTEHLRLAREELADVRIALGAEEGEATVEAARRARDRARIHGIVDGAARAAGVALYAEPEDGETMALDVFVTGIQAATGDNDLAYVLEDLNSNEPNDYGRQRKAGVHVTVRLPGAGDLATERAQWLATRFRRPVVVTFSAPREEPDFDDAPMEVAGA